MDIKEALTFIAGYTAKYGETECYGFPEWEIEKMPDDIERYSGLYRVRCNEPELIGGNTTEDILWMDGYRGKAMRVWYDRRPDFKQAYLTELQVVLLAQDLVVKDDEDKDKDEESEE